MTLEEAYKLKGQAVTEIEIWQGKIVEANKVIIEDYNAKNKPVAVAQAETSPN